MYPIKYGFQTYTWQMSYDRFRGKITGILDVIAKAGGAGFEPEVCMLGDYAESPARLKEELDRRKLQLGALCYVADWRGPEETKEEKNGADRIMEYLKTFPGAVLVLCQMPSKDRSSLEERQQNALNCINAAARRAADMGITAVFHPNSPPGSVFRIRKDYDILFEGIDDSVLGFAPDSGHLIKGGMDPLAIMKSCRPLVKHVHFKDISTNGSWVEMGRGKTDFPGIVSYLSETGYDGWIMVEDESSRAEVNPDAVTLDNGTYIRSCLPHE